MIFCLGSGKSESKGEGYQKNIRIFNKDVSEKEYADTLKELRENEVKIYLIKWVEEKDMSKDDKNNYPNYRELGGCLKTFAYKDAWASFWSNSTEQQRGCITSIPQFDAEIFKKITGIVIDDKKSELLKKAQELIDKANELKEQANNL